MTNAKLKLKSIIKYIIADYKSWPTNKVDLIKRESAYERPDGLFGGDSTYVNDYRRFGQHQPAGLIKPSNGPSQSNEPFIDTTSHKEDYIRHTLPAKFYKAKEEYKRNEIPVESMTTSHRDFTQKDLEKIRSYKPENKIAGADVPMESDTTTRLDYKRWNLEPMYKRAGEEWQPPTNQMENNTSYSTEFTHRGAAGQRAQAIRPVVRDKTQSKFEADPTYKCKFKKNYFY